MKLFRLFLIGIVLTMTACGESAKPPAGSADIKTGDFYVRSVWIYSHEANRENLSHTVVSLEDKDGKLITLYLYRLEPRVWKGMHTRISYRHALTNTATSFQGSNWPVRCENSGQDLFVFTEVREIK